MNPARAQLAPAPTLLRNYRGSRFPEYLPTRAGRRKFDQVVEVRRGNATSQVWTDIRRR